MNIFTQKGRTLLVAAVLAVGAAWLAGCGDKVVDPAAGGVVISTFVDGRDGTTYKKVNIGGQTWMAENLNYNTEESWCYNDIPDSCAKYGRLYTWAAAQEACPSGWHLSSVEEWEVLERTVSPDAGDKLKSKSGWDGRNGTNDYGFSALPGGVRHCSLGNCYFSDAVKFGSWWTTADDANGFSGMAWVKGMDAGGFSKGVYMTGSGKDEGHAVRCIAD